LLQQIDEGGGKHAANERFTHRKESGASKDNKNLYYAINLLRK
jgi:hypothetical protein